MASTEEALVSLLSADAAVTTHVGIGSAPVSDWRIYPALLPQDPVLPAISYSRVYGAPSQSFDGLEALVNARVQIDCWGATLAAAKNLATAVKNAINASAALKGVLQGESFDFEQAPREYRVMLDYSLWTDES